jgi:hypothetical protein
VSPSRTADAAKKNGNIARVGSVGPQVPEMTKRIAHSYAGTSMSLKRTGAITVRVDRSGILRGS